MPLTTTPSQSSMGASPPIPDPTGQHAVPADAGAADDPDAAADHGVLADAAVVPDLHLIVDLDALLDDRVVDRAAVDTRCRRRC
jgi:hypothetical protein